MKCPAEGESFAGLFKEGVMKRCLIANDALSLVPFTEDDMADWLACWQDEGTQRGFNFIPPEDPTWLLRQLELRFPFWATAVRKATGERIGVLRLSPDEQQPDLAIWMYPAYRGQGLGTQCFALALQYLSDHGYREIHAGCLETNERSRRMLIRCGFSRWADGDEAEKCVFTGRNIMMHGYRCVL